MKVFVSRTKIVYLIFIICLLICVGTNSCGNVSKDTNAKVFSDVIPTYTYKIVNSWPHDKTAFTQGLVFKDGILYESTGEHGLSSLRVVDLDTGNIKTKVDVANQYFAEGIAIFNGRIFQLTWLSQKGFIYDQNSLALLGEFNYEREGWGLTDDGRFLIMSDGTNSLYFLDPESFQTQKIIKVYDNGSPLLNLNELEYIKGEIYANIWHSDKIVRVDPGSGKILGWVDLTGLLSKEERQNGAAGLNGIAYDQTEDRLFVTGKLWPRLFEIKLEER